MADILKQNEARDYRLDFAKAFLILLVILGHSFHVLELENSGHLDLWTHKFIYSFHMPAFMIISGYLFYLSNTKALKTVLLTKIKSIGIPFLSFTCLMFLLGRIKDIFSPDGITINSFPQLLEDLLDYILTSKVMWFLASILINCFIVSCLSRLKGGYIGYIVIFITSFFIPADHPYIAPAYLFMFPYFVTGYYLKKHNISLFSLVGKHSTILLLLCLSMVGLYCFNRDTYIYGTGMYLLTSTPGYSLYTCLLRFGLGFSMSALFLTFIAYLAHWIYSSHIENVLIHIGMMTLGIYGFQQILFGAIIRIIDMYELEISPSALSLVLNAVIVLLISILATRICAKFKFLSFLFLGNAIRKSEAKNATITKA